MKVAIGHLEQGHAELCLTHQTLTKTYKSTSGTTRATILDLQVRIGAILDALLELVVDMDHIDINGNRKVQP